ncbi:MAG: hypothetical protein U0X92_07550 [Anaerolineales bacterium]
MNTQPTTLSSPIWKRFTRHRGAIVGLAIIGLMILFCALAFLSPYDAEKSNLAEKFLPPSSTYLLGTDALGRDLLTRILYGGRISLAVGGIAVAISLLIGVPVGALAGYYSGKLTRSLMRITDAFLSPILRRLDLLGDITRS